MPILLIVLNTVITAIDMDAQGTALPADYEPSAWAGFFVFIGDPVIALLIGLVMAVYLLLPRWTPRKKSHKWLGDAAADAGLILLITGAGGGLGQVLRDTGIGDSLAEAIGGCPPTFLLPLTPRSCASPRAWTVSMITAARSPLP